MPPTTAPRALTPNGSPNAVPNGEPRDSTEVTWLVERAGLDTAAGCVAAAVFYSGGGLTPPHGPFVPPPAGGHVTLAATAVLLAAIATDASRLREVAGAFAEQGAAVAKRLGGWTAAVAAARRVYEAQLRQHAEASKPPKMSGAEG